MKYFIKIETKNNTILKFSVNAHGLASARLKAWRIVGESITNRMEYTSVFVQGPDSYPQNYPLVIVSNRGIVKGPVNLKTYDVQLSEKPTERQRVTAQIKDALRGEVYQNLTALRNQGAVLAPMALSLGYEISSQYQGINTFHKGGISIIQTITGFNSWGRIGRDKTKPPALLQEYDNLYTALIVESILIKRGNK